VSAAVEPPPSALAVWLAAARPRTLPAAVAPVLAGSALAAREGRLLVPAALGCLAFAVLVQIGTNFANDYYDFKHGADTPDRTGPRRATAAGLVTPGAMRVATALAFAAAFAAGLTLLPYGGWPLLAVGVASIVCGWAYTGGPWPLGYHGLGDVFVFLFFGLVAVGATFFVQAGRVSADALILGAGVGALAANILLVNNYRDAEGDARARKRTLVVRLGRRLARLQFGAAHLLALAVPPVLAVRGLGGGGWAALLTFALFLLAVGQIAALRRARTPEELNALLARSASHLALYAAGIAGWLLLP
jgi:1,4-dihydroxy-2-naphthoate octaprenyltransferase